MSHTELFRTEGILIEGFRLVLVGLPALRNLHLEPGELCKRVTPLLGAALLIAWLPLPDGVPELRPSRVWKLCPLSWLFHGREKRNEMSWFGREEGREEKMEEKQKWKGRGGNEFKITTNLCACRSRNLVSLCLKDIRTRLASYLLQFCDLAFLKNSFLNFDYSS